MTTKEELHQLVDQLPDPEVPVAGRFLEYLRDVGDPLLSSLRRARPDDEPVTEADRGALREGREAVRQGTLVSNEELRRQLDR